MPRPDRVLAGTAENTFADDIFDFEAARIALAPITNKVWQSCERAGIHGSTVTLKVKFADFRLYHAFADQSCAGRGEQRIREYFASAARPGIPDLKGNSPARRFTVVVRRSEAA